MATKAALAVIDDEGLEGFSLNLVARRMGVKAPSLYYHFKDKAELLAEVARFILLDTPFRPELAESWEERALLLCIETRRGLLKHPNAAPLILQFFPRHMLLKAYEDAARDYPQVPGMTLAMLEATEKLTYGSALFAAAARVRGVPSLPPVDPERFPLLAKAVRDGGDDEQVFVDAMRMLLAGIRSFAGEAAQTA